MSSSVPSLDAISSDARWLVQAIDPNAGLARLVAMDRETYRSASFLDDRMLSTPIETSLAPWEIVEASGNLVDRSDARWIFHIGHVGSTLISRLLGEIPGVLAIREPRSLRDVAMFPPEIRGRYLEVLPRLMSRTFDAAEVACVKVTSFANELASLLVPKYERAVFVIASPRHYIASILAGENSVRELHMLGPMRAERLACRGVGLDGVDSGDAHRAAAAWACEMTSLEANANAMSGRAIAWWDFDVMLRDPSRSLREIAEQFGFSVTEAELHEILSGPLLRRYSKAMEYEYSPGLRNELIADATARHRTAIDSAMGMLDKASRRSPLLKRALERAEELQCSAS